MAVDDNPSLSVSIQGTKSEKVEPPADEVPRIGDNPFAYTPGELCEVFLQKDYAAFHKLGGLAGLEKRLRTDRRTGISLDDCVDENIKPAIMGHGCDDDALTGCSNSNSNSNSSAEPHSSYNDLYLRKPVFEENRLPRNLIQRILCEVIRDKLPNLLIIAAVVCLSLGLHSCFVQTNTGGGSSMERFEWVEGVVIIVAILVIATAGALSDWQRERQFRHLETKNKDRVVKVVRSGKPREVSVYDLLLGDVLMLEPGDIVPVDGIFVDGHRLTCDESSATGESWPVKKTPASEAYVRDTETWRLALRDPFILSGSKVLDGIGTIIVTAAGNESICPHAMLPLPDDPVPAPGKPWPTLDIIIMSSIASVLSSFTKQLAVCLAFLALRLLLTPLINACDGIHRCLALHIQRGLIQAHYCFGLLLPRSPLSFLYGTPILTTERSPPRLELKRRSRGNSTRRRGKPRSKATTIRDDVEPLHIISDSIVNETLFTPFHEHPNHNSTPVDSYRGANLLLKSYMSQRVKHCKLAMGFFLTAHGIPLAAAALTLSRGFRIASGVTASVSGVTVIPFRTMGDFPMWSWILSYSVWAVAFSAYLWLRTQAIPTQANHRRHLYLFCVIMAAVHFTIAISQGSESIPDAFTVYGPILLTASAYTMSLLPVFKAVLAGGQNTGTSGQGAAAAAAAADGTAMAIAAATAGFGV